MHGERPSIYDNNIVYYMVLRLSVVEVFLGPSIIWVLTLNFLRVVVQGTTKGYSGILPRIFACCQGSCCHNGRTLSEQSSVCSSPESGP